MPLSPGRGIFDPSRRSASCRFLRASPRPTVPHKTFGIYLIVLLFPYILCGRTVEVRMKIVWSKTAEKQLAKIDPRYRKRIESRLAGLDDNAAPVADIKKLSSPQDHYRLRLGDYRVIYTLANQFSDACYVVSVKRRTTTTYLHEEHTEYGCSDN